MLTSLLPVAGLAVLSILAAYYYQSGCTLPKPCPVSSVSLSVLLLSSAHCWVSVCLSVCVVLYSFTRSSSHRSVHGRLLLFDGVCNVCNVFVNFVLDHDPAGSFCYLPLQSPVGQQLLAKYNLPADLDSMVLIDHADDIIRHIQTAGSATQMAAATATSASASASASSSSSTPTGFPLPPFPAATPSVAYIRSTAIFLTLGSLRFPLSLACLFLLLPLAIRDTGYRAFAAMRYRVFGMSDECRIITKEGRKRFLDGSGGANNTTKKDK